MHSSIKHDLPGKISCPLMKNLDFSAANSPTLGEKEKIYDTQNLKNQTRNNKDS